jgi:hypothetical protein
MMRGAEPTIQAVQTLYNGCHFRSRLEARHAVFLDRIGIEWFYEHQGWDLGAQGWYLPDFWVPDTRLSDGSGRWIEIKPTLPDDRARERARVLAERTGNPVYIFFSDVWPERQRRAGSALCYTPQGGTSYRHEWVRCPYCGRTTITLRGDWMLIGCPCPRTQRTPTRGLLDRLLLPAYVAARSARF